MVFLGCVVDDLRGGTACRPCCVSGVMLVLWHITRQTLVSGISTTKLMVGLEKELGVRNFGLTP